MTGITENLGGIGDVSFNVSDLLVGSEIPGTFDSVNSSGKILAQKRFPSFDVFLDTHDFIVGETVKSDSAIGVVDSWDTKVVTLRVSSDSKFKVGEIIEGTSSKLKESLLLLNLMQNM